MATLDSFLVRASARSLTDPRLQSFSFLAGPCMDMSPSILRGWKTPTSRNVFVGLTKKKQTFFENMIDWAEA